MSRAALISWDRPNSLLSEQLAEGWSPVSNHVWQEGVSASGGTPNAADLLGLLAVAFALFIFDLNFFQLWGLTPFHARLL